MKLNFVSIFLFGIILLFSCSDELENFELEAENKESLITNSDKEPKQKSSLTIPDINAVANIPVFIAMVNTNTIPFRDAIVDALANWSSVTGCRVQFNEVNAVTNTGINFINQNNTFNSGDFFDLIPDCLLEFALAGQFPQGDGLTGHFLAQNGTAFTSSYNLHVATIMHEIGHTLGLIHTNWPSGQQWPFDECTPPTQGDFHIPCTPSSDNNSIMFSSGVSNPVFTSHDIKALKYLYPDNYAKPSISNINVTPNTSNTRALNFNVNYSNNSKRPAKILVQRLPPYASSSPVLDEIEVTCSVSNFSMVSPTGTWNFKVISTNHNEDYQNPSYTYQKVVQ